MKAHVSKFDLTLTAVEEERSIKCVLNYRTKLFKKETVERLAKHLIQVLKKLLRSQNKAFRILCCFQKKKCRCYCRMIKIQKLIIRKIKQFHNYLRNR
ncbi:condensation domain-containing protein [Bacillus cereus]